MIETITPESLGRPITAEDVQEGDTIHTLRVFDWQISADGELWVGEIDLVLLDDWINVRGVVIASITRPVPEQPALPTEPDTLAFGVHSYHDEYGNGFFFTEDAVTALVAAARDGFVPAGSAGEATVREAALREGAAWLLSFGGFPTTVADRFIAHFGVTVPEAEGEKA